MVEACQKASRLQGGLESNNWGEGIRSESQYTWTDISDLHYKRRWRKTLLAAETIRKI